jgi:predicted kinase
VTQTPYLIRGLPGSGKSTLAKSLAPYHTYEADDYFTDCNGKYNYDASKIGEAHKDCQENVKYDMTIANAEVICVSNTFSKRWELQPYIKLAQEFGYRITEITLTGDTYGNIHNVPEEVIERMKARWEK